MLRGLSACVLAALFAMPATFAHADTAGEVRARLERWAADFNAGRKAEACDLFSKTLVSDYRGQAEGDFATRCRLIERAIDNPTHSFRYEPAIKEIIVAGDLAIVRLDWILTVTPGDVRAVESGLDVFRKEDDGAWRIVRFMGYDQDDGK